MGLVKPKVVDLSELRCRGANETDIPTFGAVIDKAFGRHGIVGRGPPLAASIEKLSNILLVYREQGGTEQILGVCPIREYPCHFGPATLVSGALSLVAVDPAYHRRGVGQKMLACAEEHMYSHGFDIGLHFTGSPSFYQHTGWIQAVDAPFCELPVSATGADEKPAIREKSGAPKLSFRWLQSSDVADVARMYEEFNTDHPLTKVRDVGWWERRIDRQVTKRRYLGAFRAGKLQGYLCLEMVIPADWKTSAVPGTDDIPLRGDSSVKVPRIDVVEYATATSTSIEPRDPVLDAMLGHLKLLARRHDCRRIGTPLPATYLLSRNMRTSGAEIKDAWWSSLMILVVNVPTFVAKLEIFQKGVVIPRVSRERLDGIGDFSIGLAVEDPRSSRPVIMHYKKEGGALSVRAGRAESIRATVPITRQQLALVALGNYPPRLLAESGAWVCPDELIDQFGLFFPKTDGMVYPQDHF